MFLKKKLYGCIAVVNFYGEYGRDSGGLQTGRSYSYFSANKVEVGDLAIVEVSGFYKVVKVIQVKRSCSKATKWLLVSGNIKKVVERGRAIQAYNDAIDELMAEVENAEQSAAFVTKVSELASKNDRVQRALDEATRAEEALAKLEATNG